MIIIKVLNVDNDMITISDGKNQMTVTRQQLNSKIKEGKVVVDNLVVKCIDRYKDRNSIIKGYLLEDKNGDTLKVTTEQLKKALYNYKVSCENLKLTSDNRIIYKETCESTSDKLWVTQEILENFRFNIGMSSIYKLDLKLDKVTEVDKRCIFIDAFKDNQAISDYTHGCDKVVLINCVNIEAPREEYIEIFVLKTENNQFSVYVLAALQEALGTNTQKYKHFENIDDVYGYIRNIVRNIR